MSKLNIPIRSTGPIVLVTQAEAMRPKFVRTVRRASALFDTCPGKWRALLFDLFEKYEGVVLRGEDVCSFNLDAFEASDEEIDLDEGSKKTDRCRQYFRIHCRPVHAHGRIWVRKEAKEKFIAHATVLRMHFPDVIRTQSEANAERALHRMRFELREWRIGYGGVKRGEDRILV